MSKYDFGEGPVGDSWKPTGPQVILRSIEEIAAFLDGEIRGDFTVWDEFAAMKNRHGVRAYITMAALEEAAAARMVSGLPSKWFDWSKTKFVGNRELATFTPKDINFKE